MGFHLNLKSKPRSEIYQFFSLFLHLNPVNRALCTLKGGFHLHLGWNIARAMQVEMVIWKCILLHRDQFQVEKIWSRKENCIYHDSRKSNFSICQCLGRRSDIHNGSKFEAVFFLRPILKIVGDFRVCDNQEEWLLPIGQSEELEFTTNHNFKVDFFFLKNLIVEYFLLLTFLHALRSPNQIIDKSLWNFLLTNLLQYL